MILSRDFFVRDNVVQIAHDLIGKCIYTDIDGILTGGIITETEAYAGITDKACHAYNNRRTKRTEVMYKKGGIAYVYLCYGIHNLFNFVTNGENTPEAVLLRSIHPVEGIDEMEKRMNKHFSKKDFTDGPGKVTKALGITVVQNGINLSGSTIWTEDRNHQIDSKNIVALPRIGVDYAGKDALLPYRYLLQNKEYIIK